MMLTVSKNWLSNQIIYQTGCSDPENSTTGLAKFLKRINLYSLINNDQRIRTNDFKSILEYLGCWENRVIVPYGQQKTVNTVEKINQALEDGHYVIGKVSLIEKHENYAVFPPQIKNRFKITFFKSEKPFSVPTGKELENFMEKKIAHLQYSNLKKEYEDVGSIWFQVNNDTVKEENKIPLTTELYDQVITGTDPFGAPLDKRVVDFVQSVAICEAFNEKPHQYLKAWFESPKSKKCRIENFEREGMIYIQDFVEKFKG